MVLLTSTKTILTVLSQTIPKAIDLKPDYADAYTHRGMAYYRKGEMERTIEDFTKAVDLNPDFVAEIYCNRGEAWLHLGEWEKAKSDLTTARDMGVDIMALFHNDYESVPDFGAEKWG